MSSRLTWQLLPRGRSPHVWVGLSVIILLGVATAVWALTPVGRIAPGPALATHFSGVNLAGGEFASSRRPGRYGYDYGYPDRRAAAPFLAAGMTAIRLPVLWERLQPVPGGPLVESDMVRLDQSIAALRGFRLIIIDIHNYARFNGVPMDQHPEWLANLWAQLARRYANQQAIAFGLMNEPHDVAASDWRRVVDATIAAIRATGARNLVLVPGTRWTGAHSWNEGGSESNATAFADFRDPAGNVAFELHQYLDADSSGTHDVCVEPETATARLAAATNWLRAKHARGFLGEFGASAEPQCLAGLEALLAAIDHANDVWLGWTYWAGGTRWGQYSYNIQPKDDTIPLQMSVLVKHIKPTHN